ncbi:MAG: type II toxin-antitoxin system VapC family toxin [Bryobacteraceae bacterium]
MRAIDTNLLVRLVIGDDVDQTELTEKFIRDGAWVSLLVLAEAIWVLGTRYDRNAQHLEIVIEMLLQHDELILQDADVVQGALHQFRSNPTLGFSDCLILESARKAGHLPLGTFDRKLGKLDGAETVR